MEMLTTDTDLLSVMVVVVGVTQLFVQQTCNSWQAAGRACSRSAMYGSQCIGPALDRSMADLGREVQPLLRLVLVHLPASLSRGCKTRDADRDAIEAALPG